MKDRSEKTCKAMDTMIQAEIMNGEKGKSSSRHWSRVSPMQAMKKKMKKGKAVKRDSEVLTTDAQKGGTAIT